MKRTWTPSEEIYLRKVYAYHPNPRVLAERLGKTYKALKSKAKVLGLYRKYSIWTPDKLKIMRDLYPVKKVAELMPILEMSENSITAQAFKMRLRKTAEFKTERGRYGRSLQGASWNKGMKGLYTPGSEKGWFKKGCTSKNKLKVGDITIRCGSDDRGATPHFFIKVSEPNMWEELQRFTWEMEKGPIPKKHCVAFKDGDTLNCNISNLELITMKQNRIRNSGHTNLKDSYVASLMSVRQPELRMELIKRPDLLQVKRLNILLNRQINYGTKKRSTTTQYSK